MSVHKKLDVDGVGVTGGDSDDDGLVDAVYGFLCPAVRGGEILKHGWEKL
jgi:hypothetical protein